MFAQALIVAVALGLDAGQQEALDALVESRQAARAARLVAEAAAAESRTMMFYAKQAHEAGYRRSARQSRLVAAKYSGRQYAVTNTMGMMQAAAMGQAYCRQLSQAAYGALPSYYGR